SPPWCPCPPRPGTRARRRPPSRGTPRCTPWDTSSCPACSALPRSLEGRAREKGLPSRPLLRVLGLTTRAPHALNKGKPGCRLSVMRVALLLVAALFVTGGLAGCLGGSPAPAKPAAVNVSAASSGPGVAVDTGNSTNASGDMGQMVHMHDYWAGKERVRILDQDINVQPQDALAQTFTNTFRYQDPAVGGITVRPPDGTLVYEGTGKMEITATWNAPTVSSVTVRYRSAASSDRSQPKPLTSGSPVSVDVTPDMPDMPH